MRCIFPWRIFFIYFFGVLLFVSFVLPNHYQPWLVAYQEFSIFLGCFFLAFTVLGWKQIYFDIPVAALLLLSVFPLVQYGFGVIYFFGDAFVAWSYIFGFGVLVLVGNNLARSRGDSIVFFQVFAGAVLVAAVLSVWIALRQWLMLPGSIWVADLPLDMRPFANMAQPNNLATLLCMGLASVVYFYERSLFNACAASLVAVFLVFGVALTQSRTPWVGFIVISIFWLWKSRVYQARFAPKCMFFWVAGYAFCVLALPVLSDYLLLHSQGLLSRARSLERLDLWWQMWGAVWDGSLWGYGWNQVSVAQVVATPNYPVRIFTEHSHNVLLDILIWNGPILGVGIIGCIVFWVAGLGGRACSLESLFSLIVVGLVVVHGMLEFPLEYAFFLFPVGVLLGFVSGEVAHGGAIRLPKWVMAGVLSLCAGLYAWVWGEYRVLEEDHRLMRFESSGVGEAINGEIVPNVILLTQLRELIRYVRTPASEGMSRQQLEWMRHVSYRYHSASGLFRYTLALGLNGFPEPARENLLIIRLLHGDKQYFEGVDAIKKMSSRYPQLMDLLTELPSDDDF